MKPNLSNTRFNDAPQGLGDYGLAMPAMQFKGSAMNRAHGGGSNLSALVSYSREELIARIEKHFGAFSEDVDKERLVFWRAMISNRMMDSYYTRMSKSSLANYRDDLQNLDVVFADSHNHNENGVGRSVTGQYITEGTPPSGATAEDYFPVVVGDFYSHRDLQLGKISVEQFWLGLQTNILQDVSIGFKEGEGFRYSCSICGLDYWDWDCRHIAGVEYPIPDGETDDPADGAEPQTQLCFAWVENARLSEVSAVYDGATPNAMFIKAEREIRAGRMVPETETFLERKYRFFRSKQTQLFVSEETTDKKARENQPPKSENKRKENKTMADENTENKVTDYSPQIRSTAKAFGVEIAETDSADRVLETVRALAPDLIKKAAGFDAFRKTAIDAAVAEKTRAEGGTEKFDDAAQKRTRTMLESVDDIDTINEFAREWKASGDKRFEKGEKTATATKPEDSEKRAENDPETDDEDVRALPDNVESFISSVM